MSSKPLYERIIVDRKDMTLKGYTYEHKTDDVYSEHFLYSEQADKSVMYEMMCFRQASMLKRFYRRKMFAWGID